MKDKDGDNCDRSLWGSTVAIFALPLADVVWNEQILFFQKKNTFEKASDDAVRPLLCDSQVLCQHIITWCHNADRKVWWCGIIPEDISRHFESWAAKSGELENLSRTTQLRAESAGLHQHFRKVSHQIQVPFVWLNGLLLSLQPAWKQDVSTAAS